MKDKTTISITKDNVLTNHCLFYFYLLNVFMNFNDLVL